MGYSEVLTFSDSALPFDKFYRLTGGFNAIIFDVDQFRDDFEMMMDCINASSSNNPVKTIVLTEKTDTSHLMHFFSKGVDDVLLKPFKDEAIAKKLTLSTSDEDRKSVTAVKQRLEGGGTMLKWCSDYEIGVEEIDREHREIIDHFEKLYELMKMGQGHAYYDELIKFLEHYVVHHFEHEEALQERVGYSDYEHHKKLHTDFKNQVSDLMSHYDASNITNADLVKMNLYIKNWLVEHILNEDKKISRFISESVD